MKISVIIPVYNAEAYLKQCIQSIMQQTYQDFELIMVNDGSTDHSKDILEKLLPTNDKIKIINQSNQGVSGARNTGIIHATGKYIAFIDSDDFVATDYLESLMKAANNGKIDWVMSGTSFIQDNHEINVVAMEEDIWNRQELDSKFSYIDNMTAIHGKLYKKEIIDRNHLQFDISMSWAEDRDFNIEFIKHIRTVHNIPYVGYTYNMDTPNSLSKKDHPKKFINDCIYWNKVLTLCNSHHFEVFVVNRLYNTIVDNINLFLFYCGLKKTLQILRNEYLKSDREFIANNHTLIIAPQWQKYIIIKKPGLFTLLIYLRAKLYR